MGIQIRQTIGLFFVVGAASGCVPSSVVGSLRHQQDERERILIRARSAGASPELMIAIAPPLTASEEQLVQKENDSCRSSYLWKNALTWTGGGFVATAAGITIGGAYATGNSDTTGKLVFGVSAGSLAAVGSILVAVGGIVQQGFTDRGCVVK